MFTNDLIFGFVIFIGAVVINRLLAEKALKWLSAEEKARLLDSFSGHRIFHVVAIGILLLFFLIGSRAWPNSLTTLVWVILVLLLLMSLGNGLFSYVKLKNLSIPKRYLSSFVVRCVIYYGALFVLIFAIGMRNLPQ